MPAVLGFVLLAVLVRTGWGPLHRLDGRLADRLNGYASLHDGQVRWWRAVSAVLSPGVLRIGGVLAGVALVLTRRVRAGLLSVLALGGTVVLSPLTKLIVDRERPTVPHPVAHVAGPSFPSGHALTSFVAVAVVVVLIVPAARAALGAAVVLGAVVVAGAVGFSRMFLGVHYLSDIVGAWLLGTAWVAAAVLLSAWLGDRFAGHSPRAWARSRSAHDNSGAGDGISA